MHLVYSPPPQKKKKKICITIVFDFLGMTVILRRNWKQWLCKILGAKCIMVHEKMVNRKQIWCSSCRDQLKIYNILGNDTLFRLRSHGSGRTFEQLKIFTGHFLSFTRNRSLFSPCTHGTLNG